MTNCPNADMIPHTALTDSESPRNSVEPMKSRIHVRMPVRCYVEYLDDGDGRDGVAYNGSDDSVLLALECEERGSEALRDALDGHEDGNGGDRVSAHELGKAKKRQAKHPFRY